MADQRSTLTLALIDGISGPGAKANAALRGLGISATNLRGAMGGLGGIMAGLGLAFTAAELARFGKESVNIFAEHEQGLMRLRQLYNASARQIGEAHERMYAVAHEFGRPIEQVEAAMRVYGELGYSLDRAMAALPRAAKAADVLNTEIARMAGLEPLLAKAGIRNLDQAYNDLYETSKHVQGGFTGMEDGLSRVIPLLPALKWNNDEGFRRLLAYVQAIAPSVGGVSNAVEGFYNIMSKAGTRRLDTAFQRAFGKDFHIADELKKARDPVKRFMELADEAASKLGSVGALFPNAGMQAWFRGLHNNMSQVNAGINTMRAASGSMDRDSQQNAETTQRKIAQLGVAWGHFKEKVGETIVNAGAITFLGEIESILARVDKLLDEINQKGLLKTLSDRTGLTKDLEDTRQAREAWNARRAAYRDRIDAYKRRQEAAAREAAPAPPAAVTAPAVGTPSAPVAAPPAPPPPSEPYFGRAMPRRRTMTPEQIERAIPPPVAPAPVDFSDVFARMPDAAQSAGTSTGQAFNAALGTELNHSVGMIQQFTDWASKALGFRASPSIAPSFSTAVGSQGPGSRASALGRGAFSDSGTVPVR
jgi:hypothetical protein